jgi:hypothetical protein
MAMDSPIVTEHSETLVMSASLSALDLSDPDFTDTVEIRGHESNEASEPTERLLAQLDSVVDAIALKVELGSTDERLWRVLAGIYTATERITDHNDLMQKHLRIFGRSLELGQPGVTFSLPIKVNVDDVPRADVIRAVCSSPGGVTIDFSTARRVSAGGLLALSELMTALTNFTVLPQMRGIDAFVASVDGMVRAGRGTSEMTDFLRAYRRFVSAHPRERTPALAAV